MVQKKPVQRGDRPGRAWLGGGAGRRRESSADRASRAGRVDAELQRLYPDASCALCHRNPFELLVATILSAQCTDVRVNLVTPALFARFPTPGSLAGANLPEIEALIRSTGFFRNKARSLKGAAEMIVSRFGGRVPETMDQLLELPGVARKTANVVLGNAFGKNEGVVVDTHVGRLSARLGLSRATQPGKVEADLMALFPRQHWTMLSHRLIFHGRQVCTARKPSCQRCTLSGECPKVGVESGR